MFDQSGLLASHDGLFDIKSTRFEFRLEGYNLSINTHVIWFVNAIIDEKRILFTITVYDLPNDLPPS